MVNDPGGQQEDWTSFAAGVEAIVLCEAATNRGIPDKNNYLKVNRWKTSNPLTEKNMVFCKDIESKVFTGTSNANISGLQHLGEPGLRTFAGSFHATTVMTSETPSRSVLWSLSESPKHPTLFWPRLFDSSRFTSVTQRHAQTLEAQSGGGGTRQPALAGHPSATVAQPSRADYAAALEWWVGRRFAPNCEVEMWNQPIIKTCLKPHIKTKQCCWYLLKLLH